MKSSSGIKIKITSLYPARLLEETKSHTRLDGPEIEAHCHSILSGSYDLKIEPPEQSYRILMLIMLDRRPLFYALYAFMGLCFLFFTMSMSLSVLNFAPEGTRLAYFLIMLGPEFVMLTMIARHLMIGLIDRRIPDAYRSWFLAEHRYRILNLSDNE
ncbi:MAG: hypothetical protein EOP06_02315 [Proteobacteria bacterium]|nr:MAG: hypothetical protein EOP06_02315 [Pseudomonadota bacterium]